jgi:MFS superfamily sulfate permease-like transporter
MFEDVTTYTNARPQNPAEADNNAEEEFGDTLVYRIAGQLTYVNAIAHQNRVIQVL